MTINAESEISLMSAEIKAAVLAEALPYMQRYDNQWIVVKFGGNAMGDDSAIAKFASDIVMLRQAGARPVVVHGGGPQIGQMLSDLGVQTQFHNGLRVTDKKTMDVAEMVLCGSINNRLVNEIQLAGGKATGCSGKDGGMIRAQRLGRKLNNSSDSNVEACVDLGFVGEPVEVSTELIRSLVSGGFIPVIAPVGFDSEGDSLNINADTAAGAIAEALGASRLLLMSDVPGICDSEGNLIHRIDQDQAECMASKGEIHGGMIPKVETGFRAMRGGVDGVVVLDGRLAHSMLIELFTEAGCGTLLQRK